jgi:phosphohistidine phosphatase
MAIRLIFFRHGEAVPASEAGSDEDRWLTEKGRRDVEMVAKLLPWRPSIILTSPLRRARETAEIIASIHKVEVKVEERLAPGTFSFEALEEINPDDGTVLVGHAPSMPAVVSALIGGGQVKIASGGAALVETDAIARGAGVLRELITPDLARRALERLCR